MGFFTDTTVCIGCKACEVACKQWNDLPSDGGTFRKGGSYDNTGRLSGSTWRHVRFVELADAGGGVTEEEIPDLVALAEEKVVADGPIDVEAAVAAFDNWVFMSDVCKHCTNAGCLDACPTGALIRTEFETVVLQPDVCNGCGYCIPSCPFGVVDRVPEDGRAAKCTLCYDRLEDGLEPACAKACPTDSIQFGPYDELVEVAARRVAALHARGVEGAYLYGAGDEAADAARGRARRVLPADREARALRPARAGRLADPGERRAGHARRDGRRAAGRGRRRRRVPVGEDAVSDERVDPEPAIGKPASPAFGEKTGEKVQLHIGEWKDGRWSYLYGDDTRLQGRRVRPRGRARGGEGRARGRAAEDHPGPDPQPAGVDLGGAALLLVRRDRGGLVVRGARLRRRRRRALGGGRAQGRARRARAVARAADPRPRAARSAS